MGWGIYVIVAILTACWSNMVIHPESLVVLSSVGHVIKRLDLFAQLEACSLLRWEPVLKC